MNKICPTRMGTHLKFRSMKESLNFYKAFGFRPIFAYGPNSFTARFEVPTAPEKYCGVTFDVGGGLFEIADGHVAVKYSVFQEKITSSKVSAMFDVESVDEVLLLCQKEGFEVAVPIKEFPWGTKEIVVRDPDGYILVFREFLKK